MISILYSLCTMSRALAQYMCTHSHGQNTVRNRARILAWASALQSFAGRRWLAMTYGMGIMGNESDQKICSPKHIHDWRSVFFRANISSYHHLVYQRFCIIIFFIIPNIFRFHLFSTSLLQYFSTNFKSFSLKKILGKIPKIFYFWFLFKSTQSVVISCYLLQVVRYLA